ncbi:ribonuclease T2 [Zonotrichia albicollis]|uniref:Ribonuclease T2 n=1 Tax=Zonotrichia albicollis TaxID=44394 RepID=A0A8D2NC05_ZONAL|nr:ribonuclease T2 [Zonotrichia albicollis]XP_014122162.1 ribonuclease T2 [Zonotrichia albicollis]XP_026648843.1 ribonuclease T2 [Zonotrichia albicollis]XP_026648845.1 ribonuclease T2 [Zonotrichia albicollis]XP_026648846.1 ribonuclease T2 [Zonotrichia albicollis]
MKPAKLHYWILGWFFTALCCWCTSDTFIQSDIHPHAWKKLYFAHHWPVTVCKMNANDCHDPPEYWTIHGLWPDRAEDCNRTWHFNVTEIKDLLSDMRHYWPDVLHSSLNRTQFWKHEWDKHGTCAATLEVLNSQKKYFGKAIELYQHVDLNGCLLKAGIKPSSSYYKMTAIKETLTRFYGVTPKIQCLPPEEGEEAQTIGQIEFCFTKELQLVNCTAREGGSNVMHAHLKLGTSELSVCNDTLPTYYPSEVQNHK